MTEIQCAHCGKTMRAGEGEKPRLCPYCGKPYAAESQAASEPSALDIRLKAERNPKKKYSMIQDALQKSPDDFFANRALLYHGRLHEPMRGRHLDFSIIKSHLLSIFDTPEKYTQAQVEEKARELLHDPQLEKTMALAPDAEAFYAEYLSHLAFEYVDLFIRGDSKYSHVAFGFGRSPHATARACAEPARRMLQAIGDSDLLDAKARALLLSAIREAYAKVFAGYGDML